MAEAPCPRCGGTGQTVDRHFGTDDLCECRQPQYALHPQPARTSRTTYYEVQRQHFSGLWEPVETTYGLATAEHERDGYESRGDYARIVRIDSEGETIVSPQAPSSEATAGGDGAAGEGAVIPSPRPAPDSLGEGNGAAGPVRPPRPCPDFWADSRCHYTVDVRQSTGAIALTRTQLGALGETLELDAGDERAALVRKGLDYLMRAFVPVSEKPEVT